MAKHRIKIAPGRSSNIVEIDGVNIASSVVALAFSGHATQGSHLVLDLLVSKGSKIEADDVAVTIPEATARALLLLGWTAPDGARGGPATVPGSTIDRRCGSEYTRPGGRERGDRIVRCHLAPGHPGEHEEADTEVTWPASVPAPLSAGERCVDGPAEDCPRRIDVTDMTDAGRGVRSFAHGCPVDPADFEEAR